MFRSKTLLAVLATAGVSLGAVFGIEQTAHPAGPPLVDVAAAGTTAEPALQLAIQNALEIDQKLQLPVVPVAPNAATSVVPDAATVDRQMASGSVAIKSKFAGAAADREISALQGVIKEERSAGDHFRVLDAGVGKPIFSKVSTATAEGTVETWTKMQFKNPDGTWITSEPHNVIHFIMTLAKDASGQWTVQSFDWDFPPGSGP